MHIIDCVPLKRGIGREVLSYFSKEPIPLGSVIGITVRGKRSHGLVINIRGADEARTELRKASFSLKKLTSAAHRQIFSEQFINACKQTADFAATTTGSIIAALVPATILNDQKLSVHTEATKHQRHQLSSEAYIVQVTNDEERRAHYKSIIRETFARGKSVYLCVPTRSELEPLVTQVVKGIEEYAYVIHGTLSPKILKDVWRRALKQEHPIVVIGTGQILSLPRTDIGAIIIEREHSSAYKLQQRPFVDIRRAAEALAKFYGARYIVGDNAMRIETIWRARTNELIELTPASFRSPSQAQHIRVDLRPVRRNGNISWISEPMHQVLQEAREQNRLSFVYVTRRGIAPSTVCQDCGTVVLCNNCSAPIVLHGTEQNRHFLCHRCGERRPAEERCRHCNSWRLLPLGIGSEQITAELKDLFPGAEIIQIDKDHTPTSQKAHAAAQRFYNSPGSILVGTELAVGHLTQPLHTSVITSVDSLFSLPDYRIHEKIMSLALRIRSLTTGTFMLQTRMPEKSLWIHLEQGNLLDFYREEIADRERYQYPPFSVFIKLTVRGSKSATKNAMDNVKEQLAPHELHIFPAFIERVRGSFILHGILHVPRSKWPDPELLAKLRTLPQYVTIQVDPDNLL
jgi:primosomal protein N' (replication factor Y) (superfamily II helicase)